MTPVKDKWTEEYKSSFDEVDIHLPYEWDSGQAGDVPVYHKRRRAGLWTAIAALAVALAVMAAYGYSVLSNQNVQLAWLPSLAKSISAVNAHANKLESSVKDWSTRQEKLTAQVHNLDTGWQARLDKVGQHAAALVAGAYQKEQADLNQRIASLNAQLAQMTTRQKAEQTRVAQLEKNLTATRQELASTRENYNRELATLQQRQISDHRQISSINDTLSTDQVNFEARQDSDEQIVPGVSLHLTKTDSAHQRFAAWIWLAANGHRIWFRRQAIETPLVFYPKPGGEAYELVVTRVNPKGVAGYILVPSSSGTQSVDASPVNASVSKPAQGSL